MNCPRAVSKLITGFHVIRWYRATLPILRPFSLGAAALCAIATFADAHHVRALGAQGATNGLRQIHLHLATGATALFATILFRLAAGRW